MKAESGWAEALKPGDRVWLPMSTGGFNPMTYYKPAKVERLTKTQIVIAGTDVRYRRDSGRLIGGDYFVRCWPSTADNDAEAHEVNVAARADRARRTLASRFRGVDTRKLTLDQLQRINAIIEETPR